MSNNFFFRLNVIQSEFVFCKSSKGIYESIEILLSELPWMIELVIINSKLVHILCVAGMDVSEFN